MSAFKVEQQQALALMFLKLNVQASYIYLVFFGLFDLLIGYLIFRSTFLPRIVGGLMALAGLGWLTFLSPPFANHLSPYNLALGFLAELALMLWLLLIGINVERWKEQASAAQERLLVQAIGDCWRHAPRFRLRVCCMRFKMDCSWEAMGSHPKRRLSRDSIVVLGPFLRA